MGKKKTKSHAKIRPILTEEEDRFERDLESWESGEVDPYEDADVVPEIVTETEEIDAAPKEMRRRSIEALKAESWGLRMRRQIEESEISNKNRAKRRKLTKMQAQNRAEKDSFVEKTYRELKVKNPNVGKLELVKRALIAWLYVDKEIVTDADIESITDNVVKKQSAKIKD